jgi:hypothetical protein
MTSTIPTELGRATGLSELFLGHNFCTGVLPTELGRLTRMLGLGLDNITLSGSIPSELGLLSALTAIYMDNSRLTGAIPSSLGRWSLLTEGCVVICVCAWLINFCRYFGNNRLSSLPSELASWSRISILYMNDNDMLGQASTFEAMKALRTL